MLAEDTLLGGQNKQKLSAADFRFCSIIKLLTNTDCKF